jgi:perosamine synthetase
MKSADTGSRPGPPAIPVAAPDIREGDIAAVAAVLRTGQLAQGPLVERFEGEFAAYCGSRYAVAANSGTAALHLALLAHGVGPGDEVITTSFSFVATANAILLTGARPVFVDIDPDTFNIDAAAIGPAVTGRTRALVVVHLYGRPCDMDAVTRIAAAHNLALIEDACQAHGAQWRGHRVGSFGCGCFSFYPTKNMTTGEGGMVTTDDAAVAERVAVLRSHGQTGRYLSEHLGFNYRMTDSAAALGLKQLERLEAYTEARIENARRLSEGLSGIPGLVTPSAPPAMRHVFHQYTVRVTPAFALSRDALQGRLAAEGIGSSVHYPRPIHTQPYYRSLGYDAVSLPAAERAAAEVLSLPVHPKVGPGDVRRIVSAVAAAGGVT